MNIDLSDEQKRLLLETLAISWQIEYLKGKDVGPMGKLIEAMGEGLKKEGKESIFFEVFEEFVP